MKIVKFLTCVVLLLQMALFLTTCRPRFPHGVWKSEYPNIIFFMDRAYELPIDVQITTGIRYVGLYAKNDELIKLFVAPSAAPFIDFFVIDFREDGSAYLGDNFLFGSWRVVQRELHYRISGFPEYGLEQGDTIIFRRITDYEPPNFDEWFPPVE